MPMKHIFIIVLLWIFCFVILPVMIKNTGKHLIGSAVYIHEGVKDD